MAFRFKHDESVERGVQRCAREQLDKAIGELDDPSLDRAEPKLFTTETQRHREIPVIQ